MSFSAKIIADSIKSNGDRLTTFQVRYPRMVHSELMTHRVFSRNASSSRAIPVAKLIADVRSDPAMPVHWGQNQPGMQAKVELRGWRRKAVKMLWISGMYVTTTIAKLADRCGAHKQIINRLVEPWSHITVVITSTQYSNFFALRMHEDAQPEIRVLAELMHAAYVASTPVELKPGEWHLPYVRDDDRAAVEAALADGTLTEPQIAPEVREYFPSIEDMFLVGVSVARCARTSYVLHDGKPTTFEKDFALYQRLLGSVPIHASPAEHQATPAEGPTPLSGNLTGFVQYRKLLPNECQ